MKRKIIALIAALAVGGSVTAYAATAFNQAPADAATTGAVKYAATVCTSAKPSSSAVQAVLSKASTAACKNTSAAKSQTCKSGSNCAAKSACTANSCTAGTNCDGVYVCNGSGCSYNSLLNSVSNSTCGKTCSGASCSSAKTTTSKPASSAPASSSGYSAFQSQVVSLVNAERAKNGRTALAADTALMKTATLKSQDMVKNNYFSHTSPTYGSLFALMKKYGISFHAAGENIAMGQTSPSQVMNAWMNSAGHRANILSASYTKIGVGVSQNPSGTYYWTQHFIG